MREYQTIQNKIGLDQTNFSCALMFTWTWVGHWTHQSYIVYALEFPKRIVSPPSYRFYWVAQRGYPDQKTRHWKCRDNYYVFFRKIGLFVLICPSSSSAKLLFRKKKNNWFNSTARISLAFSVVCVPNRLSVLFDCSALLGCFLMVDFFCKI